MIETKEQAILLAHQIQAGFDEFAEGIRRISAPQRALINLNVSPYFATRYLLDRLHDFNVILPGADLRLTTMVDLPDFARDDVDAAVQWGFGDWLPHDSRLLVRDYKVICCTPTLARQFESTADLARHKLLHPVATQSLWSDLFQHFGLKLTAPSDLRFQDAAKMRRAALAGLGIGLLWEIDAAEDLACGKLNATFGTSTKYQMPQTQIPGFYLVLPKAH